MDKDAIRGLILDDLRNHGNLKIRHLDDKAASGLQKQIESEFGRCCRCMKRPGSWQRAAKCLTGRRLR